MPQPSQQRATHSLTSDWGIKQDSQYTAWQGKRQREKNKKYFTKTQPTT